jgi:hypothetical protein
MYKERIYMPAIKKTKSNIIYGYGSGAIISDSVKDQSSDPFILKKVEEAKIAVSKLDLSKIRQK